MWARVKGRTENALLQLPFAGAYMFRPGVIEPLHGARSKTASYRVFYTFTKPLLPVLRWAFPNYVLTTEQIGRADAGYNPTWFSQASSGEQGYPERGSSLTPVADRDSSG
jgi:hypothetical protein